MEKSCEISATKTRSARVIEELAHHLPYTLVGSLVAMAVVWFFAAQRLHQGIAEQLFEESRTAFHLFHPLHVCLSAIATTALSWRTSRRLLQTVLTGALGTIIPCGLSDYVFPYLGGRLLNQPMELHACVVAHPQMFFPFLILGILGGLWAEERLTGSHFFSHAAHILVSSVASLLYLISFGCVAWMTDVRFVFPVFLIILLAVWIPCCISDIVIPTATAKDLD